MHLKRCIVFLLLSVRLVNPANVAEVHAVRQQIVVRVHAQAELHAAGVVKLVGQLEEQLVAFYFNQFERLYLIEFIVVVSRCTDSHQINT